MAGHLFVSYSKKDSDFAFKLADDLTAQGRRVWIDRQIGGGERWRSSIAQALRDAAGTPPEKSLSERLAALKK
jgi:hypothetical protein